MRIARNGQSSKPIPSKNLLLKYSRTKNQNELNSGEDVRTDLLMRYEQNAFVLIELLVFICEFVIGCVVAIYGGREFGWIGFIFGFIGGFLILPGITFIIISIIRKK